MVSVRFSFPTATAISPFCLFCAVSCWTIQVVPKGLQCWDFVFIFLLTGNSRFEESDFCLYWRNGVCTVLLFLLFFFFLSWESQIYISTLESALSIFWDTDNKNEKLMWWWTPPSRTTDWRTQLLDRKTSVKKRSFRVLKLYGIFHSHIVVTFPWLPGHRKWAEPGCGNGDNGKFEETLALKIAFIILSDI